MTTPNWELLKNTSFADEEDILIPSKKTKKSTKIVRSPSQDIPEDENSYKNKLEEERFNDFVVGDWKKYFQKKAIDNGYFFRYVNNPKSNSQAKSIIQALMKEFSGDEIKIMIDFLWGAPHKLTNKSAMGIGMLSGNWLQTVLIASQNWAQGKFNDNPEKAVREYKPDPRDKTPDESRVFLWGDM
jgi:hypothetical protein